MAFDAIQSRLTEGFEYTLFEGALVSLEHIENPLRFNNFANAIRKLTRHILARLAPDEDVLACEWPKAARLRQPLPLAPGF